MLNSLPSLPKYDDDDVCSIEESIPANEANCIIQLINSDITSFGDEFNSTEEQEFSHLQKISDASEQAFTLNDRYTAVQNARTTASLGKIGKLIKTAQTQTKNAQRLASKAGGPS